MKAIIFGINGQDGFYLSKLLISNKIEVIGVSRNSISISGNVGNFLFVEQIIRKEKPDYIFHFAAHSTTSHSALFVNHEAISTGTLNILESCYRHSPTTRIFLSGSAVQFENIGEPIDESTQFAAISPYAISRIQSVYAGRYYRGLGLKTYIGYFFNHDSPLRTEAHVNQKIAKAALRISLGSKEKLSIGNINTRKEFNFAGDFMKAVWTFVTQDKINEVVIGSGVAYTIRDWIDLCFEKVGLDWRYHIVTIEDFKAEYNILVSAPARIMSLGWQPETSIKELSAIMMHNAEVVQE